MQQLIRDPFLSGAMLADVLRRDVATSPDVRRNAFRSPADSVGVVDWNMGSDFAGYDYAGHDAAGYDYAGHDEHSGDVLGELVGDLMGSGESAGDILGAVYRGLARGRAAARGGGGGGGRAPAPPGRRASAGLGGQVSGRLPWRRAVQTAGVNAPTEGLVRLPFLSSTGTTVFPAAATAATFTGTPQKPWRGERLVAIVTRSAGATAVVPLLRQITVGIDPQQAGTGTTPLEEYAPNAFDVRECWAPAGPGLNVVLDIVFSIAVPAGESITIGISAHGRWIS